MNRREFMRDGVLTGLAAGLGSEGVAEAPKTRGRRPNVLLIVSDEHNARVAGCYGDRVVRTPNIDRLSAEGVTFDRHYCNSPLCVPSRMSMTAGKYSSRVDVWGLTSELPDAAMPSIARVVAAAGYEPYLCGKMHYQESRRYGFIQTGGDFNNYPKNGRGKRMRPEQIRQHTPLSERFEDFHTGDHGSTVEHDRRVTAGALDFLKNRSGETPFFLLVGYLAPHFPLIVPEEFATYTDRVGMPEIPAGLLEGLPTNYKLQRTGFEETDVPAATVKRGRELYYGLTTWMDNEVGKVLAALRGNAAIAEDTIVIYTTDHGENMGEHGLWWKNCMYDHGARVPLVVRYPKRWKGGQRRALASGHVDLVKTVVELCGATAPADWDGDSLVPWMDDPKHAWKDLACSEYYAQFIAHGMVMVRTGRWKYVFHGRPAEGLAVEQELFDMEADPAELHNLAGEPKYKQLMEELRGRMVKEVGGDLEVTEQRARAQLAVGYPGAAREGGGKDG